MIEAAARRKAQEKPDAESGDLSAAEICPNFSEYKSDHVLAFSCSGFTLTGRTDRKTECFEFFRPSNLPKDASPGTVRRICEYTNRRGSSIVGKW